MTRIWFRRFFFWLITTVGIVLATWFWLRESQRLREPTRRTGYLLLACITVLALFNLRKKLAPLPLGRASLWLQFHVYLGIFSAAVFLMHTSFRVPTGTFETILYGVYCATIGSGLWGWYLSRNIPRRLSKLRMEPIYEQIPGLCTQVARQAHQLICETAKDPRADALADLYTKQLAPFFLRPRDWSYAIWPNSRLRNSLRAELASLERYCPETQRKAHQELAILIDRKDDLDFHAAHQGWLKGWLFVHIALTYILLILVVLHTLLAHGFSGRIAA